jgi:hypothetical protein
MQLKKDGTQHQDLAKKPHAVANAAAAGAAACEAVE